MADETKPKAPSPPLVFISHDTRDTELAAHFRNLLFNVSSGLLKSFYSSDKKVMHGIEYGVEWYQTVMKKLCSASDIVCLLTERSLGRPWILYEAGFAKGRSDVPIIGLALGIPLSKTSTGPFGQFQNCGDDVESLTKLVTQLTQRIPGMTPDPGIVKGQVEAFKAGVDVVIKKLAGVGGPEQEGKSEKGGTSKILSDVAAAILDVFRQRDESELWMKQDIIRSLSFTTISVESGCDELVDANMLMISGTNGFQDDFSYELLPAGRKYIVDNM